MGSTILPGYPVTAVIRRWHLKQSRSRATVAIGSCKQLTMAWPRLTSLDFTLAQAGKRQKPAPPPS